MHNTTQYYYIIIQRNAIVKRRQFTAYSIESQTPDVLHFSLTEKKNPCDIVMNLSWNEDFLIKKIL